MDADKVWGRIIINHAGEVARLKGGKEFTYDTRGRTIHLHSVNRNDQSGGDRKGAAPCASTEHICRVGPASTFIRLRHSHGSPHQSRRLVGGHRR